MSDIQRHHSDQRLSRLVITGNMVYLAGLTADDRSKDMKGQTTEILGKIDKLLAEAGTSKSRMLTATIWVTDMRDKAKMDEAWISWVDAKNVPARACVEARLGSPDTLVEIMVQAVK
jgi:enamine deaminase RidA (YjgF/YER057c/UK114 family)